MQLVDNDALGAIDQKLASPHHDGDFAEVDVFIDQIGMVLPIEAHAHPERHAVRQPELATFVGGIAWLFERVVDVLERHRPVVGNDREHFSEQRLQTAMQVAIVGSFIFLEKSSVSVPLNGGEIGYGNRVAALGKIAHIRRSHRLPHDGECPNH